MPDPRIVHPGSSEEETLRHVLELLGPYRIDVTLIGGWVPYLYQRYDDFPEWRTRIARTTELDVLLPQVLATQDRLPIGEILVAAGFSTTPENGGAIWVLESTHEMIEFFTVNQGTARQLGTTRGIRGQPDVAGIQLTQLSLLIGNTKTLDISRPRGSLQSSDVRVPTLGAYVLNKSLTFTDRLSIAKDGQSKAAKDIVYLCDIMAGGERVNGRVLQDIESMNEKKIELRKLLRTAERKIHDLLAKPTGVVDAV